MVICFEMLCSLSLTNLLKYVDSNRPCVLLKQRQAIYRNIGREHWTLHRSLTWWENKGKNRCFLIKSRMWWVCMRVMAVTGGDWMCVKVWEDCLSLSLTDGKLRPVWARRLDCVVRSLLFSRLVRALTVWARTPTTLRGSRHPTTPPVPGAMQA